MLVFDASPLIVLAAADRLSILRTFDRQLVVPERVRAEVVDAGIDAGYADARRVKRAIGDDLVTVAVVDETPLFEELRELDQLSDADAAVLAHAATNEAVAVMDEQAGRSLADAEGIDTRGTAYLVLSRVAEDRLSNEEGKAVVDDLVEAGWYCSTDLYRQITTRLAEL